MKATSYLTFTAIALGATALAGPAFAAGARDGMVAGNGASILLAQSASDSATTEAAAGSFQVFFPLDSAELDADARDVIAQAADDWQQGRSGQISVIGYSDTSGSADHNLQLSERRAEAVEDALQREGVPPDQITIRARGQDDLLVPTADGVRQEENRRVEIVVPAAPPEAAIAEVAPPPEPLPAAPEPVPAAPMPAASASEPEPDYFTFALGPVYGHNFGETDDGAESDLVGAELTFRALPGFLGGVSISQMALYSFNTSDDGLAGRSVASLDFAPDFGVFRPTLAVNGGAVYGDGVQDGFVVGPEIRLDAVPLAGFNIGLKVAYDYQFEADDWDKGILWTGLDLGIRF